MPSVNYDLKITAPGSALKGRSLRGQERSRLFGRPDTQSKKPSSAIISRQAAMQEAGRSSTSAMSGELGADAFLGDAEREFDETLSGEEGGPGEEASRLVEGDSPRDRVTFLAEGSEAVIQEVDAQLDRLEEQSKALVYEFDRVKKPDLARAIDKIFGGVRSKIDFAMYRAALKLRAELSLRLAEDLPSGRE